MSFQGIEFTSEMRKLVVNVKRYFDQYKKDRKILEGSATTLTASILNISETTVKLIMAAFNKGGDDALQLTNIKNRGHPAFAIESSAAAIVRKFVRDCNRNGRQVTLDLICKYLIKTTKCKIAPTTLWRALLRWGFEFDTGVRSAQLKESERIIIQRRRYLRARLANRNLVGSTIRPEIYLDESYVNKNYSRDQTWFFDEDGATVSKPTGKGERLIIVNAISKDGWVPDAKLVFKASKQTGDYHLNMNWGIFKQWFKDQLLPNIPENSLIILDNAPYHNVLTEKTFPKPSSTIKQLRDWLTHNEIPWEQNLLKIELMELCKRFASKPEYALDQLASEQGHSILRTPPYHPELQPIETCWAIVKRHIASNNDFTMKTVWQLLDEGFQKVTSKTIKGLINKIRKQEDEFWIEDENQQNKSFFNAHID